MLFIAYVRNTILEIKLDTEGGYTTIHGQHFRLFNLAVSMELLRNYKSTMWTGQLGGEFFHKTSREQF